MMMCFQIYYRILFFMGCLLELSIPYNLLKKCFYVCTISQMEPMGKLHVSAPKISLFPFIEFHIFCLETCVPHFPATSKGNNHNLPS